MISVRGAAGWILAPSGAMTPLAQALKESGKSDIALAKYLDVPRQYIGRWKQGKGSRTGADFPREYAAKAAEFLGVKAPFLLGVDEGVEAPIDPDLAEFLVLLNRLREAGRLREAMDYLRYIAAGGGSEKAPVSEPQG